MGFKIYVWSSVLFSLLDVVVTTVLYMHGSNWHTFREDAQNFNILTSVLDVWGTVLLRGSLLLGASIGVSWNKKDGTTRVATLSTFILFICLVIITYSMSKLLILTELKPLIQQPWTLSVVCWTLASSVVVVFLWSLLGKESSTCTRHSGGEGGYDDTDNLLGTAGEEEQNVGRGKRKHDAEEEAGSDEKERISSRATVGRLLKYSKEDAGLLSVAIVFLIIYAVCEWSKIKT